MTPIGQGMLYLIALAVGYILGVMHRFTFGDKCEWEDCYAITAPDARFCVDHRSPKLQYNKKE